MAPSVSLAHPEDGLTNSVNLTGDNTMLRLVSSAAVLSLFMATSAMAQQVPATAAKTPTATPAAPAAPVQNTTKAPTRAPTVAPASSAGSSLRGSASSPAEAQQVARARITAREQNCSAKGPAYRWVPPHVVGDQNPKGGYYTSNYAGGCHAMSMNEALRLGVVTIRSK